MDMKTLIRKVIEDTGLTPNDILRFLDDNNWFGIELPDSDWIVLSDDEVKILMPPLMQYARSEVTMDHLFKENYPQTHQYLNEFCLETPKKGRKKNRVSVGPAISDEDKFYIQDFLLYVLDDELVECSNNAVEHLVHRATYELTKKNGEQLTAFLAWLRLKKHTVYTVDFLLKERSNRGSQNAAYPVEFYMELLYYLFNEEYIVKNEMYKKAANNRKCINAWLFMSLHMICALRFTDLQRIGYPTIADPAEVVLKKIKEDTFTDNEARIVALSIVKRMQLLNITPNKTKNRTKGETIKLHIPSSCEVHMGKLFAIAEAHRQLAGDDGPLVRRVTKYKDIKNAMGDDIGNLFLKRDFCSRSATKAFLQSREYLASNILGTDENNLSVRIISHARSHKSAYGDYSKTSLVYLKDAKFNGYTPEYIAFELLERGVLSFIPAMLLEMITGKEYSDASPSDQTKMIKALDLLPIEAESIVRIVDKGKKRARLVVKELCLNGADPKIALGRICNGEAFSKQSECQCLITAVGMICPYTQRETCIGCKYEISMKSTLFLLISEYNRIATLYKKTQDPIEKAKHEHMLNTKIIPLIAEMLKCLENYDDETRKEYEELIKENING